MTGQMTAPDIQGERKRRLFRVFDPTIVHATWLIMIVLALGSLAGAAALALQKARKMLRTPCPFCGRTVGSRAARCRHCKRPLIIQASL